MKLWNSKLQINGVDMFPLLNTLCIKNIGTHKNHCIKHLDALVLRISLWIICYCIISKPQCSGYNNNHQNTSDPYKNEIHIHTINLTETL